METPTETFHDLETLFYIFAEFLIIQIGQHCSQQITTSECMLMVPLNKDLVGLD